MAIRFLGNLRGFMARVEAAGGGGEKERLRPGGRAEPADNSGENRPARAGRMRRAMDRFSAQSCSEFIHWSDRKQIIYYG